MISILIPIYNFDVRLLVQKLHRQGNLLTVDFEIICVDDASSEDFKAINQTVAGLSAVRLIELDKNIGRAAIRNFLASEAHFPYLLFMDGDSAPLDNNYLKRYQDQLSPTALLYGGRCYQASAPIEKNLYFHWYYGSKRESQKAAFRKLNPYQSFMTNNFLIPKVLFEKIKFDEGLRHYGHEDTIFGLALQQKSVTIVHLDNPLEHIGIEDAAHFIKKSEQAIENLFQLSKQYNLTKTVRLLGFYEKINRLKLTPFVLLFAYFFKKQLKKHCLSQPIFLGLFDLYKLIYLIEISKKSNKN